MKLTPLHNIGKAGITLFWTLQITKTALTLPFDQIEYLGNSNDVFFNRVFMVHTQVLLHKTRMILQPNMQCLWDVLWMLEKIECLNFLLLLTLFLP